VTKGSSLCSIGLAPARARRRDEGYAHPTPIQSEAIRWPRGRVSSARPNGTGKTPHSCCRSCSAVERKRGELRALILVPTRELAEQLPRASAVGRHTHVKGRVYAASGWSQTRV